MNWYKTIISQQVRKAIRYTHADGLGLNNEDHTPTDANEEEGAFQDSSTSTETDMEESNILEQRFQATGTLRYSGTDKLILEIDPEISKYYRQLIPKADAPSAPGYPAHITVVRTGKEFLKDDTMWRAHDGKTVSFEYENKIRTNGIYYWLNAYSNDLQAIRQELGLPPFREGYNAFHVTIGNNK